MYLVKHPIDLGLYGTVGIALAGFLCIWANYDADRQRHAFRQVRELEESRQMVKHEFSFGTGEAPDGAETDRVGL